MILDIITVLALAFLLLVALFAGYLAYCSVHLALKSGRLSKASGVVYSLAWAVIIIVGVVDLVFNWTVACVICLDRPRKYMFTERCQHYLYHTWPETRLQRYRWRVAAWVAIQTNLFEEGHI